MALTKYEQETHVSMNREEDEVRVFTANARHIRAIQKDDRFTITYINYDPETNEVDSINATISVEHYDPLTGLKRKKRELSDEERAAMGQRLAEARAARRA